MSKPTCVISGPVFNRSGYGDLATTIIKSLIRQNKYDIKISPTRWGNCQSKRFTEELTNPEDQLVSTKIMTGAMDKQPDLFIQITIPSEFQSVAKYNIGITAGIETTLCHGSWLEGINKMDLTIVLSNHIKNMFETTEVYKQGENNKKIPLKVNKPIEVCFWGADTNVYNKTDVKIASVDESLSKIPEKHAFLFVGQWTHGGLFNDRKDIGNLIKTFCNAFKNYNETDRPCLIVKTSGALYSVMDRFEMVSNINKIREQVGANVPNVYLLHGELSDVEMNALFNHEKVLSHVSFTHGEGFGHPLLLATLSGKPLLTSNWSGHLDYLNPKYSNLLPGSLVNVDKRSINEWIIKDSKWFKVAYSLAEDKLKSVYNDRKTQRMLENAEHLRKENMEKFNLNEMDKKLWGILDTYVPEFATENKFVFPKLKMINNASDVTKITLPKLKLV